MFISEKRHDGIYHLVVDGLQPELKFGTPAYFEALERAKKFIDNTYEPAGQLDYEQLLSFDAIQVGVYASPHGIPVKPLRCARLIAGLTAVKPETLHCGSCGRFALKYEGVKYVPVETKTACPTCGELLLFSSRDNPVQIDWTTNTMIESGPKTRRVAGYAREFEVDPEGIMRRVVQECEKPVHPLVIELCAKSDITVAQFLNELLWGETQHIFHKNHMKALMALAGGTSEFRMVDIKLVGHNAAERAQGQKSETPKKVGEVKKVEGGKPPLQTESFSWKGGMIHVMGVLSTKDKGMRNELRKHLIASIRNATVDYHDNLEIPPGGNQDEIVEQMGAGAHVVLLLVTPDFMDDQHVRSIMINVILPRFNQHQVRMIPVLLRPVDWSKSPFGMLRSLPHDVKSVSEFNSKDEAWVIVSKGIGQIVDSDSFKSLQNPAHPDVLKVRLANMYYVTFQEIVEKMNLNLNNLRGGNERDRQAEAAEDVVHQMMNEGRLNTLLAEVDKKSKSAW